MYIYLHKYTYDVHISKYKRNSEQVRKKKDEQIKLYFTHCHASFTPNKLIQMISGRFSVTAMRIRLSLKKHL